MSRLDKILTEIDEVFSTILEWALIIIGILVVIEQINIASGNALIKLILK